MRAGDHSVRGDVRLVATPRGDLPAILVGWRQRAQGWLVVPLLRGPTGNGRWNTSVANRQACGLERRLYYSAPITVPEEMVGRLIGTCPAATLIHLADLLTSPAASAQLRERAAELAKAMVT